MNWHPKQVKWHGFTKSTRDQKRRARREGVKTWETEIPVTDPGIPPEGRRGPPREGIG